MILERAFLPGIVMFFLHIITIFPIETLQPHNVIEESWQRSQMFKLISVGFHPDAVCSLSAMGLAPHHASLEFLQPCSWHGISCQLNVMDAIEWDGKQMHLHLLIELHWLPSTLQLVIIQNTAHCSAISTRLLPRNMHHLQLNRCNIAGTLDLAELPVKLHLLDLAGNKLKGTINLLHLPNKIREITLTGNKFSSLVASNDRLPLSLEKVTVGSVVKVKLYNTDGSKIDARIEIMGA